MRKLVRWLLLTAGVLASPFVLYALAAVVLSRLPVNADFRPTPEGVAIGVIDNGVHADLVLPVRGAGIDWRETFPLAAFPRLAWPEPSLSYVSVGWGHREFYLETPTWADLKPVTALRGVLGLGGTAMHVAYWPPLRPADNLVWTVVSDEAYRALAAHVRRSLVLDGEGRAAWIAGAGYAENDAFFEATGAYGPFLTCNEWAGRALDAAGVRTGLWTPFSGAVLDQLRAIPPD